MDIQQVAAMGGKFWTSGREVSPPEAQHVTASHSLASWFVPFDSKQPVMTKGRDGTWHERGF